MIPSVPTFARNLVSQPRAHVYRAVSVRSFHLSLSVSARNFVRASRDSGSRAGASSHHGSANESTIDSSRSESSFSSNLSGPASSSSTSAPTMNHTPLASDAANHGRVGRTLFAAGISKEFRERHLTEYFQHLGFIVRDAFVPSAYNQGGQKRRYNRGFAFIEIESAKQHQQLIEMSKDGKIGFDLKPARWDVERARSYGTRTSPTILNPEPETSNPKTLEEEPVPRPSSKSTHEFEEPERTKPRRRTPYSPRR